MLAPWATEGSSGLDRQRSRRDRLGPMRADLKAGRGALRRTRVGTRLGAHRSDRANGCLNQRFMGEGRLTACREGRHPKGLAVSGIQAVLLRGVVWMGITRVVVNAIGLISAVVLARLLMPEDFGLVALASAAAAIFTAISELSLSKALVQHADPQADHFHTVWTMNAIRGLLLALVIVALGPLAAYFYGDPRLAAVMAGFAVGSLVSGLINPQLALFERRLEFRQWILLSGGEKLAGFVASTVVAVIYHSYWALVVGTVTSQAIRVVVSYLLIPYRPTVRLNRYRELLSFSIWLTFGQCIQAISWRADPLLLGAFLPTKVVGYFGMGSRVSNLVVTESLQPVMEVLFPGFVQIRNDPDRLRQAYLRAQGMLCLVALPIGFGFAAVSKPFVMVFLGEQWLPILPVIRVFAIASVVERLHQLNAIALAEGHTKALFQRDLRGFLMRMPLMLAGLVLGPIFGVGALIGALIGHSFSAIINTFLNMRLVSSISSVTMSEQSGQIVRPAIAAAVMWLGVAYASSTVLAAQSPIVVLLTGGLIGAFLYFLLLSALWRASGSRAGAEQEALSLLRGGLTKVVARTRQHRGL